MSLRARMPLTVLAALLAAVALLPPRALADDHDNLARTNDQLNSVERTLKDARADAGALATAVSQADQAVADGEARLRDARTREASARVRRIQAVDQLAGAQDEIRRTQARLAQQARDAYMTGGMADLAMLVDSQDLSVLADRAITLDYVAADGADTLSRLDLARRRADMLHQQMAQVERERAAATQEVSGEVAQLRKVQSVRLQAKRALDGKIARLADQAASLRARSSELRRLIQQEEAQRAREAAARRAAGSTPATTSPAAPAPPSAPGTPSVPLVGGRCDLSSTSAAERWIIMHESGGDPTADNPSSTAFGLGQLLLGNRILYLGKDYATTDCGKQLAAFRTYVRERYGTAERAQAFWQANGWY
jgi:septal ring factor EnvC (AmiA/AmiB activator)